MMCPKEIHDVICDILFCAILNIRNTCLRDAERCFAEADHVHNLPTLLRDYHPELLKFYWTVEREGFIRTVGPEAARSFAELWTKLQQLLPSTEPGP